MFFCKRYTRRPRQCYRRIDPFGNGPSRGVCGADADVVVARNFGRMVAAGAAAHSDHGRDLIETLLAVGNVWPGKGPGLLPQSVGRCPCPKSLVPWPSRPIG